MEATYARDGADGVAKSFNALKTFFGAENFDVQVTQETLERDRAERLQRQQEKQQAVSESPMSDIGVGARQTDTRATEIAHTDRLVSQPVISPREENIVIVEQPSQPLPSHDRIIASIVQPSAGERVVLAADTTLPSQDRGEVYYRSLLDARVVVQPPDHRQTERKNETAQGALEDRVSVSQDKHVAQQALAQEMVIKAIGGIIDVFLVKDMTAQKPVEKSMVTFMRNEGRIVLGVENSQGNTSENQQELTPISTAAQLEKVLILLKRLAPTDSSSNQAKEQAPKEILPLTLLVSGEVLIFLQQGNAILDELEQNEQGLNNKGDTLERGQLLAIVAGEKEISLEITRFKKLIELMHIRKQTKYHVNFGEELVLPEEANLHGMDYRNFDPKAEDASLFFLYQALITSLVGMNDSEVSSLPSADTRRSSHPTGIS
jgi:hypothetical protein